LRDSAPGSEEREHPVVLFDGVCNLCNGAVQFLIARDPADRLRFAALQSERAKRMLAACGATVPLPDSMALIERGRVYLRSEAALRIARKLRFPWPTLYLLMLAPRAVRNAIYDWIARNRYRWFGRREVCMLPSPELRRRFLE
jgi:predicted DCC family thiol-disulfide oxidoreductase YuxK